MSTSGDQSQSGPPYVPSTASLGGVPSITPDVPITVIFLFLYIIFAIVHIRILRKNKAQGHKFIFNGAIFGFCKIRIITMSLRIAWACHSTNVSLGIAAQTLVYVGTIILYIVNWFFTQRVVRAQHQRFGWSLPYRIIHRLGLVFLVLSLFLLIVGSIQQHFTLDADTLNIDRALQLTGQTYFAAFSFAPMVLVALSLLIPRRRVEKFGAGRLRINISVLLIATAILSAGQIFRCVTSWVPPTPIRDAQGLPAHVPWYYSKGCFYVFNFTTEILVVIFYAIVRADLRFHIPDGAKRAGDYSRIRDSMFNINIIGQEKNLKRHSGRMGSISSIRSNETIQEYEGSLFEDSRTLADSLRHPSSVLEIDPKNGHWKIKRMSQRTSLSSFQHSNHSSSSLWDPTRNTLTNNPPPVPAVPTDWPLRESQIHRGQVPVMEHPHRTSQSSRPSSKHGVSYAAPYGTPDMEKDDALAEAIRKLEANSETNKQPPNYQNPTPVDRVHDSLAPRNGHQPGSDIPRKHVYVPNTRVADSPLKHDYRASFAGQSSDLPRKHDYSAAPAPAPAPAPTAGSDIPRKHNYNALSANPVGSDLPQKRVSSVPYASAGSDLPQKRDYSAPYAPAAWDPPQKQDYNATFGTAPGSDIPKKVVYAPPERTATPPQTSHSYTRGSTSIDTEAAEREFERFSFEASPREGSFNESEQSERDLERRYTQDGRPYRDV